MERKCVNCNIEMKQANLITGTGIFGLTDVKKGLGAKVSTIDVYVCPKCGHIELVAQNPEIFNK